MRFESPNQDRFHRTKGRTPWNRTLRGIRKRGHGTPSPDRWVRGARSLGRTGGRRRFTEGLQRVAQANSAGTTRAPVTSGSVRLASRPSCRYRSAEWSSPS